MADVILPKFDDDYNESSIIFWHKQEGDSVAKGDVLVEVQTEKAVSEIEAESAGILERIIVKRGEVATVGDTLAVINDDTTQLEEADTDAINESAEKSTKTGQSNFVRIAPRLRKLAKDLQVDLTKVTGTGRNNAITENDIKNFQDGNVVGTPLSSIRKTIARKMKDSLLNRAQLTETAYADVTKLSDFRDKYDVKLSWNTWIMFAVVKALKEHPYMNGTFENELWHQSETVELGIATDTEEGLFVPVVEKACALTIEQLEGQTNELVRAVKDKRISQKDLSGSTFTITNLGAFGIHFFTPIINPPEVAILGIGKIEPYVMMLDGEVKEHLRIPLSLTFDHQLIDGAPAARFLQSVVDYLEEPKLLMA